MSVTANLTTNVETITATIVVEEETITAEINTAARGPAGPAGSASNSITSATTSDSTANLSLSNVTTATATITGMSVAPTAATTTSTTQLATTAFVQQELASGVAVAKNLEFLAHNGTGVTITKGAIVYINGAVSGNPRITLAQANNDTNSARTIGFAKADIANGANGFVIMEGELENVRTADAGEIIGAGNQIYLSPTTPGAFTRTKPSAPNHLVYVGVITRASTSTNLDGRILVGIQNGYELNEIHDVAISSPAAKQVIKRNAGNTLWVNEAIVSADVSDATSAATANTLVLRDGTGAASFGGPVVMNEAQISVLTIEYFQALTGAIFTYGGTSASDHRIALGAGTTGATLFGAATAAAARATLGLADKSITKIVECECFSNTTPGAGEFASGAVNGGSCINSGLANANHPGVIAFRDAATTANSGFRMTALSDSIIIGGGELAVSVFNLRSARSTQTVRFGILETTDNTTPTKGVWLEMVGNGTGVVITGKTVNGGAITSSGTTYTAAVSTWYSARIELTSASSATFTVYNASGTSLWTDTIATTVPTGTTGFGIIAHDSSSDGATVMLDLDYIRFEINRTLTR
jgi:hypothetical protein